MERATGIEPAYTAWKAVVLPLNYARISLRIQIFSDRMDKDQALVLFNGL